MARRYNEIKGLAEFAAKRIAENEQEWMAFLDTAMRVYKYTFNEQMLIYAQRPDATACATLELWNERMHCWVNKGAKGIALIEEDGISRSGLKYALPFYSLISNSICRYLMLLESGGIAHPESQRINQFQSLRNHQCSG